MSEPVDLSAQHAAEPSSPPKAPLALPAPADVEGGVNQLEVNGQSFSLLDSMGPTVVNSDGVRPSISPTPSPRSRSPSCSSTVSEAVQLTSLALSRLADPLAHRQLERDDPVRARPHPARPR